ncbi:phosphoribosyltransferase [Burkholderia multivorans]|uniref:phosphoribosyltransferase n=1 Tax=Burkholderia ubonensis TaxID=101571 RepID=UPI000F6F41C2|nr:phosphoribosyltransferase family protein [Burkholderia ubonensis]AYZ64906.1 phosphoribosyltransferase [Burkholderia multivorans]VWB10413.1 phosphoribosyl transferase domain-containing protein [Burkholderia ubonensis]
MKKIDRYSWETVDLLARRLAWSIKEPFDAMVCVLRGGAVPGAILANELGIDLMMGMKVVQNGQTSGVGKVGMAYEAEKAEIRVPLNDVSLAGKRVLVVDDVLDSGETAALVVDEVRRRGALAVKLATLQVKTYSRFKPDYFVEETTNWIFYPWMSERELGEMERKIAAACPGE